MKGRGEAKTTPPPSVSAAPSPDSAVSQAISSASSSVWLPDLIADLRLHGRQLQDFVTTDVSLALRINRIVSRILQKPKITQKDIKPFMGSMAIMPIVLARQPIAEYREAEEKLIVKMVVQLPVFEAFWSPICGVSALGLGKIIAESGDLLNYAGPAKLWRRFGLHVGSDGRAFWTKRAGLTAQQWESAGYSPRRRSIMWNIVDVMLRQRRCVYFSLYQERKAHERAKAAAAGLTVAPAAKIPKAKAAAYISLKHIDNRARRYVGKRLLRDLWRAWRDHGVVDSHHGRVPPPAGDSP